MQTSHPSPLDAARVAELTEIFGDAQSVRELFDEFFQELDPRLDTLRNGLAEGRPDLVDTAAHAIKGSSANLGADAVRDCARTVEDLARANQLQNVEPLLDRLESELTRLRAWIEQNGLA
jgi:HPt (histidine-containing phosphotransfer) domain-containing protein